MAVRRREVEIPGIWMGGSDGLQLPAPGRSIGKNYGFLYLFIRPLVRAQHGHLTYFRRRNRAPLPYNGMQQGTPQTSSFKLVRTKMWDFINCGYDLTELINPRADLGYGKMLTLKS